MFKINHIGYFPWLLSRNSKCEELSLFAWMWLSNKQCRTQWANFILKKNCFTFIRLPRTYTCVCTWLTGISKTFNLKELYPHTQCIQCNNLPDRLFLLDKSGSWRWDFKWMAAERPKYTAGNEKMTYTTMNHQSLWTINVIEGTTDWDWDCEPGFKPSSVPMWMKGCTCTNNQS